METRSRSEDLGPNCIKVTLIFPLFDNEGEPFDLETWRWWQREFQRISTGHTEIRNVRGVWLGKSDRCRLDMMVVPIGKLEEIRAFLKEARKRFKQDAMYLDYHPVFFELVT